MTESLGMHLAAFAVGCLGVSSPAKAGQKLGLMGSASEEEVNQVLLHLETLARQRAAKIAGTTPKVASVDSNGSSRSCSARFQAALREACGNLNLTELFAHLPHDEHGRADLLQVFGMAPAAQTRHLQQRDKVASDFPSDYFESTDGLPRVSVAQQEAAEMQLAEDNITDDCWETNARAINVIRAAFAQGSEQLPTASTITGISQHCGSRRPALAKSALQAIIELAQGRSAVDSSNRSIWSQVAQASCLGCLAGIRGTKAVARVAEEALSAVVSRVAADASVQDATVALTASVASFVSSKPAQAAVVRAGLTTLSTLLPGLACMPTSPDAGDTSAAITGVISLCEDVLGNRMLSTTFCDARAVLRAVPKLPPHEST